MSIASLLVGWIGAFLRSLWGKRVPTAHEDLEKLQGYHGLPTAYLSLDERAALNRLTEAGLARRVPLATAGRLYHQVELKQ